MHNSTTANQGGTVCRHSEHPQLWCTGTGLGSDTDIRVYISQNKYRPARNGMALCNGMALHLPLQTLQEDAVSLFIFIYP